jgi:hypothetical protein
LQRPHQPTGPSGKRVVSRSITLSGAVREVATEGDRPTHRRVPREWSLPAVRLWWPCTIDELMQPACSINSMHDRARRRRLSE